VAALRSKEERREAVTVIFVTKQRHLNNAVQDRGPGGAEDPDREGGRGGRPASFPNGRKRDETFLGKWVIWEGRRLQGGPKTL